MSRGGALLGGPRVWVAGAVLGTALSLASYLVEYQEHQATKAQARVATERVDACQKFLRQADALRAEYARFAASTATLLASAGKADPAALGGALADLSAIADASDVTAYDAAHQGCQR